LRAGSRERFAERLDDKVTADNMQSAGGGAPVGPCEPAERLAVLDAAVLEVVEDLGGSDSGHERKSSHHKR
jgi:hypothetical protein